VNVKNQSSLICRQLCDFKYVADISILSFLSSMAGTLGLLIITVIVIFYVIL